MLPWLHCAGALVVVVCNALFSAIHSPLGQEISAGESPGFSWIRDNIIICMGLGLAYFLWVGWIQIRHVRQSSDTASRWLRLWICLEALGIGVIGMSILFAKTAYLFPASTVLIISVLVQGIIAFRYAGNYGIDPHLLNFRQDSANTGIFLFLLFMIGAFVSLIEPSWHRLADLIVLDSKWDAFLRYVFPSLLSGTINVWVGIGMLIVVAGFRHLCKSSDVAEKFRWAPYFLVFFALIAAFTAFLFVTLYHAIAWQIDQLYLRTTIWQLIVFFSV